MRRLDVAVLAAAVAGIAIYLSSPIRPNGGSIEQRTARWESLRDATKAPAPLFPEAVEVRVFGTTDLSHRFAKDGGALSAQEIALLRKSVYYAPPPPSIALCCIPRHAFRFYRAGHRFLGALEICFQCGCAHIYPSENHNRLLRWIGWDEKALGRIVEAHHLKADIRD